MCKKLGWFISCLLLLNIVLFSQEPNTSNSEKIPPKDTQNKEPLPLKEEVTETKHTVVINGKELPYKALAGNLLLKNDKDAAKASIFYIAYFKEDVKDPSTRPVIFCFNGGPGSSSVWLHMGIFGPRRVLLQEEGESNPPYQVIDNEYSILDLADLVFIDPVSTGYSRAAPGEEAKQFHGVDEDIESIGQFIRQFITRYERWDSPKLLAGESYGTTRAAGLAGHLHDEENIYLNGVILISSILNFQTLYDYDKGNDLPYPLFLPTMAATAWYHKKLANELQIDLTKTLEAVKEFAITDYTLALMRGDTLNKEERDNVAKKLMYFTGLSQEFIEKSNLRINPYRFSTELLKSKNLVIGRFDSRMTGDSLDTSCYSSSYDPSFEVIGAFTAGFNQYVRKELKVQDDHEYKIIANIHSNWNFSKATNQFLNMAETLHDVMTKNTALKVFVGSGYFDMATPFFGTDYTFDHLRLVPKLRKNVSRYYYDAGHMMYIQKASLIKMKKDITDWMKTLNDKPAA